MAKKIDPRDFLLNTDYELDKIVLFEEGSIESGESKDILHKLSFTPLVFGICAFNKDFTDTKSVPFRDKITLSGSPPYVETPAVEFNVYALDNEPKIHISYNNNDSPAPTLYYRLYAFEPSDSFADVPKTSSHATQFILNTDYNYCKLYKKGVVSGNTDTSITHNLGYYAQTLAWLDNGTYTSQITFSTLADDTGAYIPLGVEVTESSVDFRYAQNILPNSKIHYRIYYDET